jgi:hypothetical protein
MNYRVYNTDTSNWMTYRKDYDGHYSVVHEGLPSSAGYYVYEPCCYPRELEVEVQVTRKRRYFCRKPRTYKGVLYLNY